MKAANEAKSAGDATPVIFVLLAVGPFYIRWVMSLLGTP